MIVLLPADGAVLRRKPVVLLRRFVLRTFPGARTRRSRNCVMTRWPLFGAASARTGLACGNLDHHCAPGEKCCGVFGGPATCATSCDTVDGSFYTFECGRKSDCATGQECCLEYNAGCESYVVTSRCVVQGYCNLCSAPDSGMEAGGRGILGCDPAVAECSEGHTCTRGLPNTIYTGCSL